MTDETFESKAHKAIEMYLTHKGYELQEDAGEFDFVAVDPENGAFVFIDTAVTMHSKSFEPETPDREFFERRMTSYFTEHGDIEGDFTIRHDVIGLNIIGEHRALISHHRGAQ